MKLRLPITLLSGLLACMANISFTMAAVEVDEELVELLPTAEQLAYYQEQIVSTKAQVYDVAMSVDDWEDLYDMSTEEARLIHQLEGSLWKAEEKVSQLEQQLKDEGGSPLPDLDSVDVDSLTTAEKLAYYDKQLLAIKAAAYDVYGSTDEESERTEADEKVAQQALLVEKMKQDVISEAEKAFAQLTTEEKISYYQDQLSDLQNDRDTWSDRREKKMSQLQEQIDALQAEKSKLEDAIAAKKVELEQVIDSIPPDERIYIKGLVQNDEVEAVRKDLRDLEDQLDKVEDETEKLEDKKDDFEEKFDKVLDSIDEEIEEYEEELKHLYEELVQPEEAPIPLPTSSTVNAPGTAQRDALRNQMFAIRDRIANLGRKQVSTPQQQYWVQPSKDGSVPGHFAKSSSPATATDVQYQMWVEGNGGYTDLNEQSGRGGYRLQTWGGTVGAAALLDNDLTLGAAFSAQWGDLTSSGGQEWAKGDLDSLYLHLFGHYQSNAWGHTLILSGTKTDATLNRSGFIDGDYFNTHGDTDGYGFGALYELTYDIPLNDSGSTLLQPLFDVSIVHTQLDAYDETGTKALHVGKQEWTTGSVALGARLSGTFGSESWGHPFFGEVRASVSQDFGDTRGKTSIAWADNPAVSNTAYGSKVGATAVQVGAGISTPLTSYSSLYANVGADFRDRENSVGGALGVRFTF